MVVADPVVVVVWMVVAVVVIVGVVVGVVVVALVVEVADVVDVVDAVVTALVVVVAVTVVLVFFCLLNNWLDGCLNASILSDAIVCVVVLYVLFSLSAVDAELTALFLTGILLSCHSAEHPLSNIPTMISAKTRVKTPFLGWLAFILSPISPQSDADFLCVHIACKFT